MSDPASLVGLSDVALLEVMREHQRLANVHEAHKLSALAEYQDRLRARFPQISHDAIDAEVLAQAQVGAALGITKGSAANALSLADALRHRLPQLGALVLDGSVDVRVARLAEQRTSSVSDEAMPVVDAAICAHAKHWGTWGHKRITDMIDKLIIEVDVDGVRQRRASAKQQFGISISTGQDGACWLNALLPGEDGAALKEHLAQLAEGFCRSYGREPWEREFDAFRALLRGDEPECQCGQDVCPKANRERNTQVLVHVVANATALAGVDDTIGYLVNHGVISADHARDLARGAKLRVLDPRQYKIPTWLSDSVKARDVYCRFPGCEAPAWKADVDHTAPFGPKLRGRTERKNLKSLCRMHHLVKTFHRWEDHQHPDGTVQWRDPHGGKHTTTPHGAHLFPNLAMPQRAKTRAEQHEHRRTQERALNHTTRNSGQPAPF